MIKKKENAKEVIMETEQKIKKTNGILRNKKYILSTK